jgi:type IX secretion system PorP/SprF family membrane protein
MISRKRVILFFIFVALLYNNSEAQDSHFSQYDYSPLTINPSLTSIDKKIQIILHHKDQWKPLNGFRTDELSFELRFDPTNWKKIKTRTAQYKESKEKGVGFGINIFSDKAGDGNMQNFFAGLSIAYHLPLNEKNRISLGLQGGIEQRSINPNGLRYNNQYDQSGIYDPNMSSGEIYNSIKQTNEKVSAGLTYSYGKGNENNVVNDNKLFKIGMALDHFFRPPQVYIFQQNSISYYKWTIHAQGSLGIKGSLYSIRGSSNILIQGKQREVLIGFFLKYRMKDAARYTGIKKEMAVSVGSYYRYKDAIIPCLQYEMARFAIGISYDLNTSLLNKATKGQGGIEVTLRFFNPVSYLYEKK